MDEDRQLFSSLSEEKRINGAGEVRKVAVKLLRASELLGRDNAEDFSEGRRIFNEIARPLVISFIKKQVPEDMLFEIVEAILSGSVGIEIVESPQYPQAGSLN